MRIKRGMCLLLACLLLAAMLPGSALAAKKAKPSIRLGGKVGFLYVGGQAALKPKLTGVEKSAVTFASSDASVATVSEAGVIRAVGEGRAVITVSGGGAAAKCGVVVLPRSVTVKVGQTVSLPNGTVERYAVKDRDVASVSKRGVIAGRKAGSTVVALKYGKQVLTVDVEVVGDGAKGAAAFNSKAAELGAASATDQIVLVEYAGGSSATLSVHEKRNGVWEQLFETPAYVGRNGLGKTKEGDNRTPKGTFNLTTPFGILADPGAKQPYTRVTSELYWCGTSGSEYYNQLVDARVTGRKYTASDEHLIDYKGAYNYAMFIDYNASGAAGKGSCIFLHCFGKNKYTAGCVAISEASMKKIVQWARTGAKIVIQ